MAQLGPVIALVLAATKAAGFDRQWIQRHPELPQVIDQVGGSQRLTVAWSRAVGGGRECAWMTPARVQRSTGAAGAKPATREGRSRSP